MIHVALFGIEVGVLLTYLVHSTAWIVGALALGRFHRKLSPAARHMVWRAALIGPLASTAFALGLCDRWQWTLTEASPPFRVETEELLPPGIWLASCWAVVSLGGLFLIARAAFRQSRVFQARTTVTQARCIEALERLMKRAGMHRPVRLSRCAAASTPLVLSRREICLPERALELDQDALESVLAHEIAHIERRDGLWLYGALLLEAVLWFQPLNRKARAELRENAELAADDRAVELTGDALGLARTLTHVASWARGTPVITAVAMARAGSPIVARVARLVECDARAGARFGSKTPWLALAALTVPWFALAALTTVGACSPSAGAPAQAGPQPAGALSPR